MAKTRNEALADKVAKSVIRNGMNQLRAAKELGITHSGVQKHIKTNPLVISKLKQYQAELEKAGATMKKSARVISEAMDANRKVGLGHGDDFTIEEEPDHHARLKANEQFLKVHKIVGDAEKTAPEGHQHIHLHFSGGDEVTNELVTEIKNRLSALGRSKPPIQG